MRIIGLLVSLALLAVGLILLVSFSLPYLAFNLEDFGLYLIIATIVYGLVWLVGHSLNGQLNRQIREFVEGSKAELRLDAGQKRSFGLLLVVLMPYLVFLLLFALYAAVGFGLVSLSGLALARRVPVVLFLGLAIVVLGTVVGVLSGFYYLARPPRRQPYGIPVDANENTALWALTRETATQVGARPVDTIIMTPDSGIGVYLDGSLLGAIFGSGRRTLEVGQISMNGLTVGELRAILAHEYGHFSNRDTQWAPFTYSMGSALTAALRATPGPHTIEDAGLLKLVVSINPAHWILRVFSYLFFRTTSGFSRVGEVLADVLAASLSGGREFGAALSRVTLNDTVFAEIVYAREMPSLWHEGRVIANYPKALSEAYTIIGTEETERVRSEMLSREEPSAYDSHPPVSARLDYTRRFSGTAPSDPRPVTSLFDDWDSLSDRLSDMYNQRLVATFGPPPPAKHREDSTEHQSVNGGS